MRLRWKIGLTVAAVFGVALAGLGAVPHVVDVEAYKPALIKAVRETTGRELVIDGPMRLTVFPVPGIGAGTVHFSNAVGAKGAQMIDVRWVAVTPSWRALLQGSIEVGTLRLYRPTIVLETDAEGRPNWEFSPGGNLNQPTNAPSAGLHLAIGRVEIVHGTVSYTDPRTKRQISAADVSAGATVSSFDGPFEIDGSATVNGVPLKLALAVDAPTDKGHQTRFRLQVSSGELQFDGALATVALDTRLQGHLSLKTGLLSDFVDSVVTATGAPKPAFDIADAGRFSFDGDIDIAPDHIAANDFEVKTAKENAKGTLSLGFAPIPTLAGKLALRRLDLGRWLTILDRPTDLPPDPVKAALAAPTAQEAAAKTAVAVVGPSPWTRVNASLAIDIDEVLYNHDSIRGVSAAIDTKAGVVVVSRLKASMPGGLSIDADVGKGTFKVATSHLRDTLQWLGVDTSGIPQGKLEALTVEGKLGAKPGGLDLAGGTFTLDGVPGTVAGTLFLKVPAAARLDVALDQFDLDAYLPKPVVTPAPAAPPPPAPPTKPPEAKKPGDLPSLGLKLNVGKLVFRAQTLSGVVGSATLAGNIMKLDGIRIANLLGARLDLSGHVQNFGTVPRFDLAFNLVAPDTDLVLEYAGLPKFMNGKIGTATATGNIAGTHEAVTVRDMAAHFLDTDARVAGTLSFTSPVTFDLSIFSLRTPEASALVSVASGQATSGLGPIAAAGSLKGTSDRSVFTGTLTVRGSEMTGTLDATLGKRPHLAAKLNVAKTLDIDSLLGIQDDSAPPPPPPPPDGTPPLPPGPAPSRPARKATPKPINLSALRSFDATLTVSAKALSMAALKVDYADLDASLSNGVMKIKKLTGQFYKGAVDFAGTIDASGQALAIDATGSLLGIHLDELLRGTMGSNVFGSDYKVAVDGKLNATGIRMTGKGVSAVELRESLAGAAAVSGFLSAGMASGARSFAEFATGLGSLFSNNLAFDSVILNGFINRQNAVSGGVVLGNGTVTLQNQTVQGQNATAVISGRNRLAEGTTDSTIQITSGDRQFVATMKGSLSSPTIAAARPTR